MCDSTFEDSDEIDYSAADFFQLMEDDELEYTELENMINNGLDVQGDSYYDMTSYNTATQLALDDCPEQLRIVLRHGADANYESDDGTMAVSALDGAMIALSIDCAKIALQDGSFETKDLQAAVELLLDPTTCQISDFYPLTEAIESLSATSSPESFPTDIYSKQLELLQLLTLHTRSPLDFKADSQTSNMLPEWYHQRFVIAEKLLALAEHTTLKPDELMCMIDSKLLCHAVESNALDSIEDCRKLLESKAKSAKKAHI